MKKITVTTIALLVSIGITAGLYIYFSTPEPEMVHYHTGFLVVQNGEVIDLSGDEYMYIAPCGIDPKKKTPSTPAERVHLHNRVGDVLHIHHAEATIEDVLVSLNIRDTSDKWYAFSQSGNELTIDTIIPDSESIVITDTILESDAVEKLEFPSEEYITMIENDTMENCGS